jgi:hypothetical protein
MKPSESGNEPVALSQMKGKEPVALKPIESGNEPVALRQMKWQRTHGIKPNGMQ